VNHHPICIKPSTFYHPKKIISKMKQWPTVKVGLLLCQPIENVNYFVPYKWQKAFTILN